MTPWRRAAVALVLALTAMTWAVVGLLPQTPPDPGGLILMFMASWGAGLIVAGLAGRRGAGGLLLSLVAAVLALALGAAVFGLMLVPPQGAVIVPAATLHMAAARPALVLLLAAGALAAHAVARR